MNCCYARYTRSAAIRRTTHKAFDQLPSRTDVFFFLTLNLIHGSSCEMFTFCGVLHETIQKILDSAQYELEIIFNRRRSVDEAFNSIQMKNDQ